jgi:hypothetical protein
VRAAALACLVVLLAGTACEHRPRLRAKKAHLTLLPLPWRRPSIHIADGGTLATFSVRDTIGYHVVTPEGAGPSYQEVSAPLFAPKSDRVFYLGVRESDGRRRNDLVAGSKVVSTPIVDPIDLVTAPGGARWALVGYVDQAPKDTDTPGPVAMVVDGKEVGRWAAASKPAFSPDGAHVAWLARAENGETTLVVDGAVVRTFAASTLPANPRFHQLASVQFLSDGRVVALAPEGASWVVVRGDQTLATYAYNVIPGTTFMLTGPDTGASIAAPSLATAADVPVAVWWERMPGAAERWRVVRDAAPVDGMECANYWGTQPPVLTADGAHLAYVCPTPVEPGTPLGKRWVMLDGRRFGTYVETWTLGVSPDGTQVAYGAADTLPIMTWQIMVNGTPRTPREELVWRPRFSPDGRHVLWAGGPERGRRRLGIDGRVIVHFDDVLYGPEFPAPHTAVWVIRRGRKITRLQVSF